MYLQIRGALESTKEGQKFNVFCIVVRNASLLKRKSEVEEISIHQNLKTSPIAATISENK